MGFKCPVCLEDFKYNKKAWVSHIKNKHKGQANIIVGALTTAYEKTLKELMNSKKGNKK